MAAWGGIFIVIAATATPILISRQNRSNSDIVILVADFEGSEPEKYGVTETVLNNLRSATGKYTDVKVEALKKVITEKQGSVIAREEGIKHNATIVIWGWYRKTSKTVPISVNFEILKKPESYVQWEWEKATKGQIRRFSPDALESFQVQTILSKNMTYLTLTLLGLSRYSTKDYDGAIDRFTAALGQVDDSLELTGYPQAYLPFFYRGISQFSKKNNEQAIFDMSKVIELAPFDFSAYLVRGFMNAVNKSCNSSISDFNRSLEINPKSALVYSTRGGVFATQEKYEKAVADFTKVIQLKPNESEGYHHRAMVYRRQKNYDKAISDFTTVIQMNSGNIDNRFYAYFGRALSYGDKQAYEKSVSDYSEAIKLKPRFAEAYVNRGDFYHTRKEYDNALLDFHEAIKIDPKSSSAYNSRARVHFVKNDYDKAIPDFSKVIELESTNHEQKTVWGFSCENQTSVNLLSSAYYSRGLLYVAKKEFDKALSDFENSIRSSSDNIDSYVQKAYIYLNNKDYGRAINEFNSAINKFNSAIKIKPKEGLIYRQRGFVYTLKKDYEKALSDYTQAIEIKSDDASAYNGRGIVYGEKGAYDKALSDLNQAIELKPDFAHAYDSIGTIYRYMKNYDLAINNYNQALKLFEQTPEVEPNTAESYFWRGITYQDQGKLSDAISDFQKAVQIPDNPEFKKKAEEKLQQISKQKR